MQQRREAKAQQQHQLEMQNMAFRAEMEEQRAVFLFEKEKNAYNDRRKHRLDDHSKQDADNTAAELFRREVFLSQNQYERNIHSGARTYLEERRFSRRYVDDNEHEAGNDTDTGDVADGGDDGDAGGGSNPDKAAHTTNAKGDSLSFNPFLNQK